MNRKSLIVTVLSLLVLMIVPCLYSDNGYQYQTYWGSMGIGDTQFNIPYGLAFNKSRTFIYVTDSLNHFVKKFDLSYNFAGKWGGFGASNGMFNNPAGIATDNFDFVYVVDKNSHRVQKFSSGGTFNTKWGGQGTADGMFQSPVGIAIDNNDYVYVADQGNNRIQKFNSNGLFIKSWGSMGTADGQYMYPSAIAIDSSGYLYVADQDNHRIQKCDSSGNFITKWGSQGFGDGQLFTPMGITIDNAGFVYVSEANNNRFHKFTSTGTFVTKFGTGGDGTGQLYFPIGIAVGNNGNVYVADANHHKVQVFAPEYYTIRGYVRDSGSNAISGVTMQLTGDSSLSTTTNGLGYYEFASLPLGTYTVTPSKQSYFFNPVQTSYNPLQANSNQDYAGTQMFNMSGYVRDSNSSPLSGAKVSLSTIVSTTEYTTGDTGYYEFLNLTSGSYTVTCSKTGYTFNPNEYKYTALTSDITGLDFTGTAEVAGGEELPQYFIIYGYAKNSSGLAGLAIEDVEISLSGDVNLKATTDINGRYDFKDLKKGKYKLKAAKSGYVFHPAEIDVELTSSDVSQEFIGRTSVEPEKKTSVRKNLIDPAKGEKTTIVYKVDNDNKVEVKIYNVKGTLVRVIMGETKSQGSYNTEWDGKDDGGNIVSSGVYRAVIKIGDRIEEQKIVILR